MTSTWRYLVALVLCAVVGLGAVACGGNPPPDPPLLPPPAAPEPPPAPPEPPPLPPEPPPEPLSPEELFSRMSLDELNSTSPLDPVFFNYDEAEVLPDARASLQRNADWMRKWPTTRIMVQGHCDERGTNEYNLSLGDERASAARDYLVSLGVSGDRIATVSKGEEEPFCSDAHEGCWSRNRRGHFIVTTK